MLNLKEPGDRPNAANQPNEAQLDVQNWTCRNHARKAASKVIGDMGCMKRQHQPCCARSATAREMVRPSHSS